MAYFRKNRIAAKYSRRAKSVGPETAKLRGQVAKILIGELRDATQKELYDRTPLPVTGDMMRSIRPNLLGNKVEVGYFYWEDGRDYGKYRVNMSGISPSGGHLLDMHPAEYLRKHANPRIEKATKAAQKRIIGN